MSGKIVRRLSWRSSQVAERSLQRGAVERASEPHGKRDGVGRALVTFTFQPVEEPEPALRKGQRNLGRPRHRTQGRPRRLPVIAETLDQRLDGRRFEQAADGDLDIERGADAADQPRRQQRMAAEREEVVVDADPGEPQHLGKQSAQQLLLRRARAADRRRGEVRRRQRLAVELAVGRERKLGQRHERRRHHVVRQARTEMRAQRRCVEHAIGACRHHIGHQPLVAGLILARDHRRLRHIGMPQQRRLDLAGLDAEAAHLHLRIGAPEEVQNPVRAPARQSRRCGTCGSRPARTGRPRSAPPSARRARDSPAPAPPPRCKARPQPRPAPAASPRLKRKPACSRSDGRSGERPHRISASLMVAQTVVSVGP